MGKPWEYFIVSFFDSEYKKAIAYLGSHSGRNENKIENAGLTAVAIGKTTMNSILMSILTVTAAESLILFCRAR
jgi:hypothetical protein|nr:hypothetical protein [uncultured Lachnoanaerobaculum sp.]